MLLRAIAACCKRPKAAVSLAPSALQTASAIILPQLPSCCFGSWERSTVIIVEPRECDSCFIVTVKPLNRQVAIQRNACASIETAAQRGSASITQHTRAAIRYVTPRRA